MTYTNYQRLMIADLDKEYAPIGYTFMKFFLENQVSQEEITAFGAYAMKAMQKDTNVTDEEMLALIHRFDNLI